MKLIVISSPDSIPDEMVKVNLLFKAGMECFHLRKPKHSSGDLQEYLDEIEEEFRRKIMIHSHHKLASTNHLRGIHFPEGQRIENFQREPWALEHSLHYTKHLDISTGFHSQNDLLNSVS